MSNAFNPELFKKMPVVGILRFFKRNEVEKLVPASMAGGLCNIEVTMNSEGAEDLIRLTCDLVGGQGNVGAGTVTTIEEMDRALEAGASFIVTPAVIPEVIRACVERKVPVMPGAMTGLDTCASWWGGPERYANGPTDFSARAQRPTSVRPPRDLSQAARTCTFA